MEYASTTIHFGRINMMAVVEGLGAALEFSR